jgi:hypothetical protein
VFTGVKFWHSVKDGILCGTDSIPYVSSLFNFMEFWLFVQHFVSFSQRRTYGLKLTKKTDFSDSKLCLALMHSLFNVYTLECSYSLLPVRRSLCLFVLLSVCLCAHLSVTIFLYLSVRLSVSLSMSVCTHLCLSVRLSFGLPVSLLLYIYIRHN